jgi:hypothetical protein
MEEFLSPSFRHDKLENPTFEDLVDVFEDLWKKHVLVPCEMLLRFPHGDVAAMTVLSPYFEAIWIHLSGEDSDKNSKKFFVKGFSQVFKSDSPGLNKAAEAIYEHVRCGLAHEGALRRKVHYSREGAKAFFLTYPKKPSGELNFEAPVVSIILNPYRVYEGVKMHFEDYVRELRSTSDKSKRDAFKKTCERLWGIGENDNIVGMTEKEFRGKA